MSYKPNYANMNEVPDTLTPTGRTSRECVEIEEAAQKSVAENKEWLIARKMNSFDATDTRKNLEAMGFEILAEADDLFFPVNPPAGWTKETNGYWTNIYDAQGVDRISQFYKGAFYDRDAFINITKVESK